MAEELKDQNQTTNPGEEIKTPQPQANKAGRKPANTPKKKETGTEVTEDPRLAKKMKELDEALRKANEFNARMEQKEKELDAATEKANGLLAVTGKAAVNVAQAHASKAQRMKENLKKQPKVRIFIPLEGKEKPGSQLPVTLNGYRVNVPKGRYVDVPEQIGQIVADSLNQTVEAENRAENLDIMSEDRKERLT